MSDPSRPTQMAKVELDGRFSELRLETVRKGVRVTLRGRIWSVHRGQNGPNGADLVPYGPAFRAP